MKELKTLLQLRIKFSDDYHHAVYMDKYDQAKMYEAEMIRLDTIIISLSE